MSAMVRRAASRSPLAGRRRHARPKGSEPSAPLEAPAELDVLHEGDVGIATHGLEDALPYEDGLIARRDPAPAGAKVHEAGDHAEHRARAVEADIEAPAYHACIVERGRNDPERAVGEARVGVEEEERVAASHAGPRVHLTRAAARAGEELDVREACRDLPRGVLAAAVDQDDLGLPTALVQVGQEAPEIGRLVERGHDDADQDESRAVSLRLQS